MQITARLTGPLLAVLLPMSTGAIAGTPLTDDPNGMLVVEFLDTVFNQHKVKEGFDRYVGTTYRQHNPFAADGREAAVEVLSKWLAGMPTYRYDFKHVYVDGDTVIVHSHVTREPAERGSAVVDIFRLEDGKVVEHWDVIQPIPEKSANDNTMF